MTRPSERPHARQGAGIEIVEVGGRSGVFQHSVALARSLARNGRPVLLHTATDHEHLDDALSYCTCFRWYREARRGRPARIALSFLLRTVPHLARRSRGRVVWVQGTFKPALTAILLIVLRLRGVPTILSPHNLFDRDGGRLRAWVFEHCVGLADHVVVYNEFDHGRLRDRHASTSLLPLVQFVRPVPDDTLRRWRAELPADRPLVAAVGQIRPDKNLPLLIEAATLAGVDVVVIGPEVSGLDEARRCATRVGARVHWYVDYHPLDDLGAVLRLTGTAVCPYSRASQSGVAELARSYGATVVASDVGGLRAQADVLIGDLTPAGVAEAIARATAHRGGHAAAPTGGSPSLDAADDLLATITGPSR